MEAGDTSAPQRSALRVEGREPSLQMAMRRGRLYCRPRARRSFTDDGGTLWIWSV